MSRGLIRTVLTVPYRSLENDLGPMLVRGSHFDEDDLRFTDWLFS